VDHDRVHQRGLRRDHRVDLRAEAAEIGTTSFAGQKKSERVPGRSATCPENDVAQCWILQEWNRPPQTACSSEWTEVTPSTSCAFWTPQAGSANKTGSPMTRSSATYPPAAPPRRARARALVQVHGSPTSFAVPAFKSGEIRVPELVRRDRAFPASRRLTSSKNASRASACGADNGSIRRATSSKPASPSGVYSLNPSTSVAVRRSTAVVQSARRPPGRR
jgi:hypothetical protein